MHVLVIPLETVDSVLYPVLAPGPDCKQRTAFVALPLRSSYSRHTLHVIESRESTHNNSQFGSIRIPRQMQQQSKNGGSHTSSDPVLFDNGGSSYSGKGQCENGRLYIKYRRCSQKNGADKCKTLMDYIPCYSIAIVLFYTVKKPNIKISIHCVSFRFLPVSLISIMYDSRSIQCV